MSRSRLVLLGLLLAIGLIDLHALVLNVQWHGHARDAVVGALRQAVIRVRPRLAATLAPGGAEAWEAAAGVVLSTGLGDGVELVTPEGRRLLARPEAPAAVRPLGPVELDRLRAGDVVVTAAPDTTRLLTHVLVRSGEDDVVVRLATPVPDLTADLGDRRQMLVALAAGLVLVMVAGALVAAPARREAAVSPPRALVAYEEAMGLLRARGEQASQRHDEERRRLAGQIEEKESFARAGEITASIVHEMRNGLGTILGYARLLEKVPGAADHARNIREECEALEAVVRGFMEFLKHERLQPSVFDLGRMLSRVVANERRGEDRPEVTVEAAGITLSADEELLERAFANLVRNARQAAGPAGRVRVAASRADGVVVVTVADDGPGMTRDQREALRPFLSTKKGGLGLGLAMALKIVHLHGGTLGFVDRQPHGLIVRVALPAAGAPPPGSVTGSNVSEGPASVKGAE